VYVSHGLGMGGRGVHGGGAGATAEVGPLTGSSEPGIVAWISHQTFICQLAARVVMLTHCGVSAPNDAILRMTVCCCVCGADKLYGFTALL
jgi:hypothetical protein